MDLDHVDLTDPSLYAEERHHEVFAQLRRVDPVHWQDGPDGTGFWSLTRHADVVAANRDATTFVSSRGFTLAATLAPAEEKRTRSGMLLGLDPPVHTRQRRIVNRGFTPRVINALESHLAERARRIVDAVVAEGRCDLVTDIAARLPLQAIAELIGIPEEDREQVLQWGNRIIGFDDPEYAGDPDERMEVIGQMYTYAGELRRRSLEHPGDDLVTRLTATEVDGEQLGEVEFGEFFLLLSIAGNETTRNAFAQGVRALAGAPDQLAALRDDPSPARLGRAVEEILRWATPAMYFRRTATRDVQVGGRTIREGDRVVMWFVSANRDEDVFAEPFRFDIGRDPNDHVAFGAGGPHLCLGAHLARLELRLLLREVATRLAHLTLDGPVQVLRSNLVGGVKHLPVRWDVPVGAHT